MNDRTMSERFEKLTVEITQSALRALLVDAFTRGRDYQRQSAAEPVGPQTEALADEWRAHLSEVCGEAAGL